MKYAIVESGGKQYQAVEGGILEIDRMPIDIGESIKLEQVLLLADGENVIVGTPVIKDNPVWTKVVAHFKGKKVTIFNYSPKKRIRVKTGHRQNYTRLLVEQIGGSTLLKKEPVKVEKVVEVKTEKATPKTKADKVKAKAETPSVKDKKPAASSAAKKTTTKAASKASAKGTTPSKAKKPAAKAPVKTEKKTTTPTAKKSATTAAKKTTASKTAPKKTSTKATPASSPKKTSSPKGKKPAAK